MLEFVCFVCEFVCFICESASSVWQQKGDRKLTAAKCFEHVLLPSILNISCGHYLSENSLTFDTVSDSRIVHHGYCVVDVVL
jgi:hypothetical protein